jgi:hypothetical protein
MGNIVEKHYDYVEILSTKFMIKTMLEYYDFLEII